MKGKQGRARAVYINGVLCKSLTKAAKYASSITGYEIEVWEISRMVEGKLHYIGLEVGEKAPKQKAVAEEKRPAVEGRLLLRYPPGESPIERGLGGRWH